MTFMNFRFKPLLIDIIHRTSISSLREKVRQNEKALILDLISFLLLNRLCPKGAPEHIIKGQSSLDPFIFIIFCGKYCPNF